MLEGFTLTNGMQANGGGITCSGGSPTIRGCRITACVAMPHGGGIFCGAGVSPVIDNCTIDMNTSVHGGGLYAEGHCTTVTVLSSTISANQAKHGGAIHVIDSTILLESCPVDSNMAIGTIGVAGSLGGTDANAWGGGFIVRGTSSVEARDTVLSGNTAASNVSTAIGNLAYGGGALVMNASSLVVDRCRFLNNSVTILEGTSAYGLAAGGALMVWDNATATVQSSLMVGNSAPGASGEGGGVWAGRCSSLDMVNATLCQNAAPTGAAFRFYEQASSTVANTIVWSHGGNPISTGMTNGIIQFDFCDIEGGWAGAGASNITADPMFKDPTTGDYHLMS